MLKVSPQMAGVVGPCPKCSQIIKAPMPELYPHQAGYPSPVSWTTYPPTHPAGAPAPLPDPTLPTSPMPGPAAKPPLGSSVPIEPRHLNSPSPPKEPALPIKVKPEPSGNRDISSNRGRQVRQAPTRFFLRAIVPLAFIGATALLIFAVLHVLSREQGSLKPVPTSNPEVLTENNPANPTVPPPPQTEEPANTTPEDPPFASVEPPAAPIEDQQAPAVAAEVAMMVLEKFLKASSLEERIPYMETRQAPEELADTVLNAPLPKYRYLVIHSQESFRIESIVDFYFTFEFINEDGSGDPQTVCVRRRGERNPTVLADPFLDLYGGRLAAFAATPQPKGQSFHAIIYPVPVCADPRVPNRQKKLTLRLLPHENSTHIIQAHASRISKIGEILKSGSYDLNYGKPKACVVLLVWNTDEEPGSPYLEALDIQAFHWNP